MTIKKLTLTIETELSNNDLLELFYNVQKFQEDKLSIVNDYIQEVKE